MSQLGLLVNRKPAGAFPEPHRPVMAASPRQRMGGHRCGGGSG
jgi:hypothetical protein